MAHTSPLFAPQFIATRCAKDIAIRLREDEDLINTRQKCSWVAWHLPDYSTERGKSIASYLAPLPGLGHDINQIIYENLCNKIRRYLIPGENISRNLKNHETADSQDLPTSLELANALKVIMHLQRTPGLRQDLPIKVLVSWLEQQVAPKTPSKDSTDFQNSSSIPKPPPLPQKRCCYICRLVINDHYPSYPSLCIPCGAFNHASSLISLPPKLILPTDFTALVTGARLNLGYHTALRLLRCGARVMATSRYPRDAVARYLKEEDSDIWKERLRVVGADFRSAADAFALVHETKSCLRSWAGGAEPRLDALINNAAQTLTDSVKKEERAIDRERMLGGDIGSAKLLIESSYTPRIRGEALPLPLGNAHPSGDAQGKIETPDKQITTDLDNNTASSDIEPYSKSSWVQSLSEIPYEDVMSAHAVNSFVPLILIRELLPLMGSTKSSSSPTPTNTKPQGYIINVSSREGIFEDSLSSTAKRGKHVHTNMSKAALNMITETEAATAWQDRRVAMTTVDPGYMSAAPEYEHAYDGVRPIGWEDGAGRVLWPLAVGEIEGKAIVGRFLKHYGAVEVDPGVGRG
jgi:NAD(P)-dependent dehydrogenase (short-subunit alcohol dehydrogenase family)